MKQGKSVINLVIVLIAAALLVYFSFYVFDTFNDPFSTTLAYSYTSYDSVEADGMLVRQEQVLPNQSGIVDVTRSEGEKVGVGQTVALVYRDSQAQNDQAELDALALEIELLEYAISQGGDVESAARLDEDILQSVVALRSSAAMQDFSLLEEQVMNVKSSVLKRGYTYGDGLTAADLSAQLQGLKSQYSALNSSAATATTRVKAGTSGTFSTLVDGYETTLTPETIFQLTPELLHSAMDQQRSGGGGELGKLIVSDRWYFTTVLSSQVADRLLEGTSVCICFTGDFTQDVDMRVEQVGSTHGDEVLVVFSSNRYLSRTTLLRQQTAELIFDSWTGLRIPKEALRMVKSTYTDQDTQLEVETSQLGVYVLISGRAEFKPVEVAAEGGDYYVVKPTNTTSKALRAGDEVITRAVGLFQGQLLEF